MKYVIGFALLFLLACQKDDTTPTEALYDETPLYLNDEGNFIYFPNAFTPNADGKNDILKPIMQGVNSDSLHWKIMNEDETIIYDSNSGLEWDGKTNGQVENAGRYKFKAYGSFSNGTAFTKNIYVYLMKYNTNKCIEKPTGVAIYFADQFDAITGENSFSSQEIICP